jgi:hypothetical protein
MTRTSILILAIVSFGAALHAGDHASSVMLRNALPGPMPSGNARIDFTGPALAPAAFQEGAADASLASRKSPWLAGGLSLVLPGAGEFYAQSYLKSALFLAAEAALWLLAYNYDHKGDRQTDYFQNYANAHWSVVKYVNFAAGLAPGGIANYPGIFIGNTGDPPSLRVNWAVLNKMESDIAATPAGQYFSHNLPAYNSQQYYELIGKYPQFNEGWDDTSPPFVYGNQLSAELLYYSGERGKANTYYTTASTYVALAFVNHVVSAVDAALTAGSYNRGLHASVGSQTVPAYGGYTAVPVLRLSWGL